MENIEGAGGGPLTVNTKGSTLKKMALFRGGGPLRSKESDVSGQDQLTW